MVLLSTEKIEQLEMNLASSREKGPAVKDRSIPDNAWSHPVTNTRLFMAVPVDMIYTVDGYSWALDSELKSVCVGKYRDVEDYFNTGDNGNLTAKAIEILSEMKRMEAEGGNTTINSIKTVRPGNKRSGLVQSAKHYKVNTRHIAVGKRLSVYPVK